MTDKVREYKERDWDVKDFTNSCSEELLPE
jgi:hypothetical protein